MRSWPDVFTCVTYERQGGHMSMFCFNPRVQSYRVRVFCVLTFCLCHFLPLPLSTSRHAAKEYVDSDPSGRRGLPITTIKQGAEPPTFTGWFQAWDPKMWETDPLDRIRARF